MNNKGLGTRDKWVCAWGWSMERVIGNRVIGNRVIGNRVIGDR